MDPAHRDRIAFVRICSGQFKRGAKLKQARTGKVMAVHNPMVFLAQDRDRAEEAFPGDIIGIPGHGALRIGDTLTEKEDLSYLGVPNFAPEVLSRVRVEDPLKAKHLQRALEQLGEEGAAQSFKRLFGGEMIVGVVGPLQMDVLAARLEAEYNLAVRFEPAPFDAARWLDAGDAATLKGFADKNQANMAEDYDGAPVYLAKSGWYLARAEEQFPDIRFLKAREQQWQNPVRAA
jgi:peptide chain release factor 3